MGGMKEWVQRCQPVQLYLILGLTILVFLLELVVSHITHALTLLMDSYHMLCNIIALIGCIATIKYGNKKESSQQSIVSDVAEDVKTKVKEYAVSTREKSLKNTFGWARLDVIVMLICCVFLASLSFSLVVEALQTLVHINHQDEMHYPIPVMCVGALGILLNGICYVLIGGFTFHQGSFLYVTKEGDVVLNKVVTNDSVKQGERRLSRTQSLRIIPVNYQQRQGFREMCRDIIGCVIVVITSIIVYLTDKEVAKYIDPSFSILSAVILMYLSFPYMKESCLILLQTIPGSINIKSLKAQLLKAFPDIINVHDLHVWQLTAHKVISTAHIIFQNPTEYVKISEGIKEFFLDHGITQVTIQPEFKVKNNQLNPMFSQGVCLMKCQSKGCQNSSCCNDIYSTKESVQSIPEISITPCDNDKNGGLEIISVVKPTPQPVEANEKKKVVGTKPIDEEEQPINRPSTNDEDIEDSSGDISSDTPNNLENIESITTEVNNSDMCSNTNINSS